MPPKLKLATPCGVQNQVPKRFRDASGCKLLHNIGKALSLHPRTAFFSILYATTALQLLIAAPQKRGMPRALLL